MLDADLALLYGVSTKRLNEQVKRNWQRFPDRYMFQLSAEEVNRLRSHSATSKKERGGRRYLPFVFTEHGAIMLACVLNSPIATRASLAVIDAFVHLRMLIDTHKDLSRKIKQLENKYDAQFRLVFDAIRELMDQPDEDLPKIKGFKFE